MVVAHWRRCAAAQPRRTRTLFPSTRWHAPPHRCCTLIHGKVRQIREVMQLFRSDQLVSRDPSLLPNSVHLDGLISPTCDLIHYLLPMYGCYEIKMETYHLAFMTCKHILAMKFQKTTHVEQQQNQSNDAAGCSSHFSSSEFDSRRLQYDVWFQEFWVDGHLLISEGLVRYRWVFSHKLVNHSPNKYD